MSTFFPVQAQPFTLFGAGAVAGSTTIQLTNFNQINGTPLTMANFGSIGFFTLEPGNGTLEEPGTFTGITANSDGTVTLTGVSTQLTVSPYTQTAGLAQSHAGGVYLVLSNTAGFYNEFPNLPDNATVTGVYTFTTPNYPQVDNFLNEPTASNQLATKYYVDQTAVSGAPNATTTVKGIVQLSSGTQIAVGTVTGSTGASLVPSNSLFSAINIGGTAAVVAGTAGYISATFGGTAFSVATLNGTGFVVQTPALATIATVAGVIPITDVNATLNTFVPGAMQSLVANDTINASTVPQCIIVSPVDGKVYRSNATSATATAFYIAGFVTSPQSVTASQAVVVQVNGTVHGFTGLTPGAIYYSSNTAGAISATAGSQSLVVGQADSTGKNLQIIQGKKITSGTTTFSSTATAAIVCGFQPSRVTIYATVGTGGFFGTSGGGWDVNGGNNCSFVNLGATNTSTAGTATNAWEVISATGLSHIGTVINISTTGFVLSNSKTSTPPAVQIFWQAES